MIRSKNRNGEEGDSVDKPHVGFGIGLCTFAEQVQTKGLKQKKGNCNVRTAEGLKENLLDETYSKGRDHRSARREDRYFGIEMRVPARNWKEGKGRKRSRRKGNNLSERAQWSVG